MSLIIFATLLLLIHSLNLKFLSSLTFHPFVQPIALRVMLSRYRRIMSAINYFDTNVDPFELQKDLGLTSAVDSIATLSVRVNDLFSGDSDATSLLRVTQLQTFVLTALWGNRMDLSIWPVGGSGESEGSRERASEAFSSVLEAGQKMILSNHMDDLTGYVQSLSKASRMDIIVDNAGFELYCDLCLADFLIFSGLANCVYLQLKAHPTFVSDAMSKDVMHTIHFLQNTKQEGGASTPQSVLGDRWLSHIEKRDWILSENFFWAQPQPMWDIPDGLRRELATSSLVFVKGDANYRRLLGDRHWDFATSFQDVVSYFPAPVCALRTLKAELGCGMPQAETTRAENEDPNWLVAGKFGVVQFCDTRKL